MNGEYRGNVDLGRLMHDFGCADADDMNFALIAERTRYLKENPKGISEMCQIIEDMRKQEREEATHTEKKMTVLRMLADGPVAFEKIAQFVGLSLDEVKTIQAGQGA